MHLYQEFQSSAEVLEQYYLAVSEEFERGKGSQGYEGYEGHEVKRAKGRGVGVKEVAGRRQLN